MNKKDDKIPEVPRLSPEIKNMNGKSSYKLRQCIDTLCEILDEEDKADKSKIPQDN